ncbi:hypothetical protein DO97_15670 [Neosynechococcus sphagnicola sy1]|uniref:Glycosyltransferase 2-like domain-containing protein n=1 Tax=Neosynechococcus sphagnicola sy1 TaxID=1497020 RepID=A0A098TI31_9CYAN|nr:tetratricopeptide repeat protein [Neosynechococcus sphagnicola]KGF71774.1 hypothetical protein DO97_15670 [Neosynechococcus sphagnicola sy1]
MDNIDLNQDQKTLSTSFENQEELTREIQRGDQLLADSKLAEAAAIYMQTLQLYPTSAILHYKLGDLNLRQNQWVQASQYFHQAIELQPDLYWAHYGLGQILIEQGQLHRAAEAFRQAIELKPDFVFAHYNLAQCLTKLDFLDQAFESLQQVIELDATFHWGYFSLGKLHEKCEQHEEAIAAYRKVIELEPHHSGSNQRLALLLDGMSSNQSQSQVDKPKDDKPSEEIEPPIEVQTELDSGNEKLLSFIRQIEKGDQFVADSKLFEAAEEYLIAIQIDPTSPVAHYKYGDVGMRQNHWEVANQHFHQAIELQADFHWGHYGLGQLLKEQGQFSEAIKALQRAIEIKPDFIFAHYNLGRCLIELEHWDEASELFRNIIKLDPDFEWGYLGFQEVTTKQLEAQKKQINEDAAFAFIPPNFSEDSPISQNTEVLSAISDVIQNTVTGYLSFINDENKIFEKVDLLIDDISIGLISTIEIKRNTSTEIVKIESRRWGFQAPIIGILQSLANRNSHTNLRFKSESLSSYIAPDSYHIKAANSSGYLRISTKRFEEVIGVRLINAELMPDNILVLKISSKDNKPKNISFYAVEAESLDNFNSIELLTTITLGAGISTLNIHCDGRKNHLLVVIKNQIGQIIESDFWPDISIFSERLKPNLDFYSKIASTDRLRSASRLLSEFSWHSYGKNSLLSDQPNQNKIQFGVIIIDSHARYQACIEQSLLGLQTLMTHVYSVYRVLITIQPNESEIVIIQLGRLDPMTGVFIFDKQISIAEMTLDLATNTTYSLITQDFIGIFGGELIANLGDETDTERVVTWNSIVKDSSRNEYYTLKRPSIYLSGIDDDNPLRLESLIITSSALLKIWKSDVTVREHTHFLNRLASTAINFGCEHRHLNSFYEACIYPRFNISNVHNQSIKLDDEWYHIPLSLQIKRKSLISNSESCSIIINFRNKAHLTIDSIKSFLAQDRDRSIEFVLINNRSNVNEIHFINEEVDKMKSQHHLCQFQIIDYESEFNHSAQCNLGAKLANNDLLVFANNDIFLMTYGLLDAVLRLCQLPRVATVGTKLLRPQQGKNQKPKFMSGGIFYNPNILSVFGKSNLCEPNLPASLKQQTILTCGNTFGLVAIQKYIYEEIGGLDEINFPTDYNDVDFSIRALQKGFSHLTVNQHYALHLSRASRGDSNDLEIARKLIKYEDSVGLFHRATNFIFLD